MVVGVIGVLLVAGCAGHGSSQTRFRIAAVSALFDAPLGVTITGVPAGQRITVTVTTGDTRGGTWESKAVYLPDPLGTVDLATTAPVSGAYTGAHDTGLIWSLNRRAGAIDGASAVPANGAMVLHMTATVAGRQVASASVTRQLQAPGIVERKTSVDREGFPGALYTPRDTGAGRPAVLAFGGSEGGTGTGMGLAQRLASRGYPALGIGYFREPGLPKAIARIPLEYFVAALRWLASQPGVDPRHINVYGASRGSEAALLLGVHFPDDVFGVIAGSPSSVVNPGYPAAAEPAWTLAGQPLPGVNPSEYRDPVPTGSPDAIIPVERIPGPVFLICGENDLLWPSCRYADAIAKRRDGHPYTELREPGAGHDVCGLIPNLPVRTDSRFGGDQQSNALGRLDAWPRLLSFLAAQTGQT